MRRHTGRTVCATAVAAALLLALGACTDPPDDDPPEPTPSQEPEEPEPPVGDLYDERDVSDGTTSFIAVANPGDGAALSYLPDSAVDLVEETDGDQTYAFKDTNGNGALDPWEDWRLAPEERAAALIDELPEDVADALGGGVIAADDPTTEIESDHARRFSVERPVDLDAAVIRSNELQAVAEALTDDEAPYLPVVLVTDPFADVPEPEAQAQDDPAEIPDADAQQDADAPQDAEEQEGAEEQGDADASEEADVPEQPDVPVWPGSLAIGATSDLDAVTAGAEALARALRAQGIAQVRAPTVGERLRRDAVLLEPSDEPLDESESDSPEDADDEQDDIGFAEPRNEAEADGVFFNADFDRNRERVEAFAEGLGAAHAISDGPEAILTLMFATGLYDDPFLDPERSREVATGDEMQQAARAADAASVVVLKNDNGAIACEGGPNYSAMNVYVVGEPGGGPSMPVDLVVEHFGEVLTDELLTGGGPLVMVPDLSSADIVLVGVGHDETGELTNLEPLARAAEGVEITGKYIPIIALMDADGPIAPSPIERHADAIAVGFGIPQDVLLDVALGEYPYGGQLPVTFPALKVEHDDGPNVPGMPYTDGNGHQYGVGFGLGCNGAPID